jgi:CcmD family protein
MGMAKAGRATVVKLGGLALGLLVALLPATALAQSGGIPPGTRLSYLFAAFIVVWALFFAYAFYVARRQQELRREVDALRRNLEAKERGDSSPPQEPSPQEGKQP